MVSDDAATFGAAPVTAAAGGAGLAAAAITCVGAVGLGAGAGRAAFVVTATGSFGPLVYSGNAKLNNRIFSVGPNCARRLSRTGISLEGIGVPGIALSITLVSRPDFNGTVVTSLPF